jgi:hypothetical protein
MCGQYNTIPVKINALEHWNGTNQACHAGFFDKIVNPASSNVA